MSKYNTRYEKYSQSKLIALFSSDNWKSLTFSQRIDACQEIENRYATENNVQPCLVTHEPMNGAYYGWQNGNTICLNSYLLRDGQFCTSFMDADGKTQSIRTNALAPGWNTLETVYHEGTHGIQEQTGKMPSTYISPEMDDDLYRIQGTEKEAFANGQLKTLEALSDYEKEVGHLDPERNEYIASVKSNSFQAALIDASHNYNDPDIEQTLQTVINDREYGISRTNASDSYKAIDNLCDSYSVYSFKDISSSTINVSSASSSPDKQLAFDNTETEEQSDINLQGASPALSSGSLLDDGLSDSSVAESSIYFTDNTICEDGIEELSSSDYSTEMFTDDGIDTSISDNITLDQDDGVTCSEEVTDYGSSEQPYDTDGLDNDQGTYLDSYTTANISASNESDY